MYRKTVYCEYAFWQTFIKACPSVLDPSERNMQYTRQWINLYCFLAKSNIIFDLSVEEFQLQVPSDSFLLSLWQKSTEGACGLKCKKNNFPYIQNLTKEHITNNQLNAVYLTNQTTEICNSQSQRFGIIILNLQLLNKAQHIFQDSGTAFPSPLAKDWNFMRGLLKDEPKINISNTLIITDNYLLFDNQRIKYNLLPILKILLPYELAQDLPYQICIFTEDKRNILKHSISPLVKMIKQIRPHLDFQLMIYHAADVFHDRAIITNNIWISCGHGFDIFTANGPIDKATTINIVYPFFQTSIQWADQAYINLLHDAQAVDKQADLNVNYWGIRKHGNRLFNNT